MTVKEVKARYKWRHDFSPLLKIDHLVVTAFHNQHIITLSLLSNLLWFEVDFSAQLTTFKIGVGTMYFIFGGGANEK
tara:strand:- start:1391 stop:1621 length:231 start_codon:yes stop_codon:yes gene_type:complete